MSSEKKRKYNYFQFDLLFYNNFLGKTVVE